MRLGTLEWDADGDEYWRRFPLSSAKESQVPRAFHIAVASGKGGTGKTTISTNLAVVLADAGIPVTYGSRHRCTTRDILSRYRVRQKR